MAATAIVSAFNAVGDRVFVQDEHYAWLPATVLELEEDRALVRIDWPSDWNKTTVLVEHSHPDAEATGRPQERWVALREYFNHQLPQQSDGTSCRDLADLPYLHEATVLQQLKERHCRRLPYTRVGDILVSVKPCQWIPDLYSSEQQRYYHQLFGGANQDYLNGT
jgi:myosin-5